MKGFLHIVEIVIAGILVFIIAVQFMAISLPEFDWQRTKLMLLGNDILFTLDKKGIDWFNSTEVDSEISSLLPENILYSLEIRNTFKPYITVGCICDDQEFDILDYSEDNDGILSPFELNGHQIEFHMRKIDPISPIFPHDADVIVSWDYNLTSYQAQLMNYLSDAGSFMEIRDLDESDIDSIHRDILGVVWNESLNVGSGYIYFTPDSSENEFYPIVKYFYHIPNSSGEYFTEPHLFSNFLNGEKISQSFLDPKLAIMRQYGTNIPACVVNNKALGRGKTIWLSDGDNSLEDRKVLIKALILWAAGDVYPVISNRINNPVTVSMFKIEDGEMFQPIEIALTLGRLY